MEKPKTTIEQLVLNALQKGTTSALDLIQKISLVRVKTTKQGVYRVLRKLKNEEKIVIHGKSVSLNFHWIRKMNDFFSLAQFYYSPKSANTDNFLNINDKDKIVYFFKNLNLLDSFWSGHAFLMLNEILPSNEPIFVYNPHEWFAYARQDSEQTLIETIKEKKRQVLITVAHDDFLDKELKKKFSSDLLQYNITDKKIFKNNYYLNIYGDYLIEVFIDPDISKDIDNFFKKTKTFDDKTKEELFQIVAKEGKNKLIISRNEKKAEKYKKILSKDFYIKKA